MKPDQPHHHTITADWRRLRRRIGRQLHALRVARQLPLEKLSALSGLSVNILDRYELGKNEIDLHTFLRLSHALRVDISVLVTTGNATPPNRVGR